ncbi:hypothetical protein ARALYDRAFT_902794 [Arabidopsis lyrata subsp. lyrata]|uniref:Uncharacterized protein n=1 Tax=Arabidopsis lyrata subsp. lyrata TaxID=81972 RepID=D7LJ70_ARALL|nr:hypothetical protein ARALYDRAFT_902794 [Arabidopsis lyrata subsp. lyrata]
MVCKSLVMVLIFVSLFGLHQCEDIDHPKGIERCYRRYMGRPLTIQYLCCIEAPRICFTPLTPEQCLTKCPPLRKGAPPSSSPGKGVGPSPQPSL